MAVSALAASPSLSGVFPARDKTLVSQNEQIRECRTGFPVPRGFTPRPSHQRRRLQGFQRFPCAFLRQPVTLHTLPGSRGLGKQFCKSQTISQGVCVTLQCFLSPRTCVLESPGWFARYPPPFAAGWNPSGVSQGKLAASSLGWPSPSSAGLRRASAGIRPLPLPQRLLYSQNLGI